MSSATRSSAAIKLKHNNDSRFFKLYDSDRNNQGGIIRLIFSFVGVSFTDKNVKQDEWNRVKDGIPILQLTILRVNNEFKIYDTNAIIRYLAREFRLYGTDNREHAFVDISLELNRQFREKLVEKMNNVTDDEQRKTLSTQFAIDHGTDYLNQLENIYKRSNHRGPFYLGSQVSIANLIIYQITNYLLDINPNLLDTYSLLQQASHHLEKHRQLAKFSNRKGSKRRNKRYTTVSSKSHHVHYLGHAHYCDRSHDGGRSFHQCRHRSKKSNPRKTGLPDIPMLEKDPIALLATTKHLEVLDIEAIGNGTGIPLTTTQTT